MKGARSIIFLHINMKTAAAFSSDAHCENLISFSFFSHWRYYCDKHVMLCSVWTFQNWHRRLQCSTGITHKHIHFCLYLCWFPLFLSIISLTFPPVGADAIAGTLKLSSTDLQSFFFFLDQKLLKFLAPSMILTSSSILTSDPWDQQGIFLLTSAAHWFVCLFFRPPCVNPDGRVWKILVDQQFVKFSDQPVWHQQPRPPQSKSLQSPSFFILMLALNSASRLHPVYLTKYTELLPCDWMLC